MQQNQLKNINWKNQGSFKILLVAATKGLDSETLLSDFDFWILLLNSQVKSQLNRFFINPFYHYLMAKISYQNKI